MPQIINTNIASINAQRNLDQSQRDANVAFQRLSSGLRINSAKDDAAGLAISTRFESQISGLNVAQRNASDGISLAQTTEGALNEVINNLQRIRDLAVQSANATNSASDRLAIDREVQARLEEINRIAEQTSFNGLMVLDGSFGTQTFQVGANAGDTISINLSQGTRLDQIGTLAKSGPRLVANTALAEGDLTISVGNSEAIAIGASANGSAKAKAEVIDAANIPGLTSVEAENEQTLDVTDITLGPAADNTETAATYVLSVAGVDLSFSGATDGTNDVVVTEEEMAQAINGNAELQEAGISASFSAGKLTIDAEDGRNFSVNQVFTANDGTAAASGIQHPDGTTGNVIAAVTFVGTLSIEALDTIAIGGNNANYAGFIDGENIAVSGSLEQVDVKTVAGANDTIKRIDSALTAINGIRSELGAIQNRFQSTIANLATTAENLSAANSRIRDADFAAMTAELSRTQVLQQAGLSILAQANARPQQVLQLLQG